MEAAAVVVGGAETPNFIPASGFFSGSCAMVDWPLLACGRPNTGAKLPLLLALESADVLLLLGCRAVESDTPILIPPLVVLVADASCGPFPRLPSGLNPANERPPPNLIPPEDPIVRLEVVVGLDPPASDGLLPGFGVVQATHVESSALFCTKHVSHVQPDVGGANPDRKLGGGADCLLSGFKAEQAIHFASSVLFTTKHVSQVQLFPPEVGGAAIAVVMAPGFAVVQATHLVSVALFCTRHVSHDQPPDVT